MRMEDTPSMAQPITTYPLFFLRLAEHFHVPPQQHISIAPVHYKPPQQMHRALIMTHQLLPSKGSCLRKVEQTESEIIQCSAPLPEPPAQDQQTGLLFQVLEYQHLLYEQGKKMGLII